MERTHRDFFSHNSLGLCSNSYVVSWRYTLKVAAGDVPMSIHRLHQATLMSIQLAPMQTRWKCFKSGTGHIMQLFIIWSFQKGDKTLFPAETHEARDQEQMLTMISTCVHSVDSMLNAYLLFLVHIKDHDCSVVIAGDCHQAAFTVPAAVLAACTRKPHWQLLRLTSLTVRFFS